MPRQPRKPSIPDPTAGKVPKTKRVAPQSRPSAAIDYASGRTAKAEAERSLDLETAAAIEAAKNGDDSLLLPYQPTPSINPPRPRTLAAGYDRQSQTMRVRFRDGAIYEYYDVPSRVWNNFKRVKSPGRAINRYFPTGAYPYSRMDDV